MFFGGAPGPVGMEVICVGGRRPERGDSERFDEFWLDQGCRSTTARPLGAS